MNRTAGSLAAAALALLLPVAGMQAATPPAAKHTTSRSASEAKTYRWVDKDGVVHFGDSVPPEYASSQKQVLNDYGVPVATESGLKTAEQVAAEKAAAKKAAEERQKAILASRRDQVLLDTYLSVDEIEALRDRRIELIDTQIKVTENYLQGLRDILQKLQAEAAGFKPYSPDPQAPPIDQRLAKELSNTMDSIMLYEKNLADTRNRKADVLGQFTADITRFKELKAAAPQE
ncbi:MAG: DUF4124 domain-containing protein [Gammaproteobacteria bacterium]|nr:DUF4124 domain-containing protein [Gammaproteobacteria bacterium]QOJ32728.1 MAG: DUF4124 domain-containing protein [Gammaproteobacteria bacterium]